MQSSEVVKLDSESGYTLKHYVPQVK